ncbi:trihelix transcription factor GT-2 isoform X1 [Cucurbita pepo subsp. pepo]|uniref:trihelix transcription factor GT-2 isoform X1 n=2 Tax=Cucurbita pepo subsp. pepo TaxID=3664 RepID=UPI000C9D9CC5|nr:trihelix transcription factor GT-2 isoform X1 [Cucurbita pepo subsp. pepo]
MDLFTGDHRIPSSDSFPQHVAPFPDSTDLLYAAPSAVFPSADIIAHLPNPPPPPQKLRPIRCNGRSPAGSQADNIFDGALRSFQCVSSSPEGGFSGDQLCVANIDPCQYFNSSEKDDKPDAKDNGGFSDIIGNNFFSEEETKNGGTDAATAAENLSRSLEGPQLDDDSCSTSDGGDDVLSTKKHLNHKRKRTTRSLELFVENLIMKVMDKQEEMHRQLIDMIEKNEKERIVREEAWKQREIERMRRDEELRAQETSRSLAIISFIQNLLGHEIQISQPVENHCTEDDGGESSIQKELKSDPSSRRWPRAEVQSLISLRTSLEHKFRATGSKGSIWEEISVEMQKVGYNRSAKKCKEKWENMNKYFKRTIGTGKASIANGKTCPYFQELDTLYRNGVVNSGAVIDSTSTEHNSQAERSIDPFHEEEAFVQGESEREHVKQEALEMTQL